MSTYKNLTTVCAAAVLAFGLAACGGGDDDTAMEPTPPVMPDPEPMEYDVALPAGHGLNPGTTTIPAGTTAMLASGTYIACDGTEDCTLTIGIESVTGALSASSTGGMVAVSTAASRLAAVHAANQQTLVNARAALAELEAMDPGEITPNQLAAAQMALASALALSGNEDAPENQPPAMPDPEPTPVAVAVPDAGYLDDDNMPMAGTHMLAAGETATSGGVTFLCAEGGDACEVTIADDGSVEATGGTVTASLTADAMTQVADAKAMTAEMDEADRLVRRNRAIGEDRALESAERLVSGTAGGTSGIDVANIIPSRSAGMQASVRITAPAGYAKVEDMMNGDWGGTRRSRVTGPNTDELVVFTDREEPTLAVCRTLR
ncbi:MAG: hypothetical protein OXC28_00600 [Defluviicoccus sp.]|nr:hypothetical protein [Defluviicoccus sp.]